jgi:type I restriction enzyme M protein
VVSDGHSSKVAFIWEIAELLRGDYKRSDYGKVILPFVVLRRLDCVLADSKEKVLAADKGLPKKLENREPALKAAAGQSFYNLSKLDFLKLLGDEENLKEHLEAYIRDFSSEARDVLERFSFQAQIDRLASADLLFRVVSKFAALDLHPSQVSNLEMGYMFEELIRRFSEQSNETAGEHFTPREVIRLMVNLLFIEDTELLTTAGKIVTMLDPAAGTGGMLSVAEDRLRELNSRATLKAFGQELNEESYAICKSDLMIKGQDPSNIQLGNSFTKDAFEGQAFDYLLANPPFGVDWSKVEGPIRAEHEQKGFAGRFGPGLPRKSDGQLLFLLHMMSKMRPADKGGSRIAIVFNGSPLFSGGAGSGESEIRRHIIENDMLEAVVGLPDQLFYNTGISTYVWIVTNRKANHRKGKVQLVDAREQFVKMRKSLGDKRKEISPEQIDEITRLYGDFEEGPNVKILPNDAFGFKRITVERPLRLIWRGGPEAAAALESDKAFRALADGKGVDRTAGVKLQNQLTAAVTSALDTPVDDVKKAEKALKEQLGETWSDLKAPARKALLAALAVRDKSAPPVTGRGGKVESDADLRDNENVPLGEDVDDFLAREVLPYAADAWVDHDKTKIGYEIPFTRHFHVYTPPRPLEEIDEEIRQLEQALAAVLGGLQS